MTTDDAFEILSVSPPALTPDAAAAILMAHYGIAGELAPLASERDQNFRCTTAAGTKYVLKISNSAEAREISDFHAGALLHVAEHAPELPVPRVQRTLDGETMASISAPDGRRHLVRLLTWLDGVPLHDAEPTSGYATTLGDCLARLDLALKEFEHPASGYALLWDLKRASALRRLLDCVDDTDLRALCTRRLDTFELRVLPRLDDLRWQVIHNDLNWGNVLVDPENAAVVTGVIDFGDVVCSPLIADIAVGAAYLLRDDDDPLADVLDFVAAYCGVSRLEPAEIDLLYDLMLTRSTMTILISHWRAARYPENREYILGDEARSSSILARACHLAAADVTARLQDRVAGGQ